MEIKINEGLIKGAQPPKLLSNTKIKYMKDCICKISGKSIGTGFFCKIYYQFEFVTLLITNYHVLDDDYIKANENLYIYIDNHRKIINTKDISIIYSSKSDYYYDIIIIRLYLKEEIKNYLEIDQTIFNDNSENSYNNELIYILYFPLNGEATVSYGKGLVKIDQYNMKHECNTENCSSGGPILDGLNNKVIGIHKGYIKNKYNIGTFLKFPLQKLSLKDGWRFVDPFYIYIFHYFLTISFVGDWGPYFNYLKKNYNTLDFYFRDKSYRVNLYTWEIEPLIKAPSVSHEGAIIVYNISERDSFSIIEYYFKKVEKSVIKILVGDKYEEKERKVSYEEGKNLANKYGMAFYEANFITGENMDKIFTYFVNEIIRKIKEGLKVIKSEDIKDYRSLIDPGREYDPMYNPFV